MTWATTKATGVGTLRFAIVIEGWPDTWVTDPSITYAPDEQTVRVGLSADGIVIQDRVIMHEARLEQQGNTFKIRPPQRIQEGASQWSDYATRSFSKRTVPVAMALEGLDAGGTTAPDIQGGADLEDDTYYWIGSEAVKTDTAPTISRGRYSSIDQTHFIPTEPTDPPLYLWPYPPTMEGRRVYLYVWGTGDPGGSQGTLIWRGIVRRPPVLARDGVGWDIQCSSITDVLKQTLAGDIKTVKPVGIYHHAYCAVKLEIAFGIGSAASDPIMIVGWDANEAAMRARINAAIATRLVDSGADSFIDSLVMTRSLDGPFRLELRTKSSGADGIWVRLSSPIIGGVDTLKEDAWASASSGELRDGILVTLATSTTYSVEFKRPHDSFFNPQWIGAWEPSVPLEVVNPLGYANEIMARPRHNANAAPLRGYRWQSSDPTDLADNPPWRMYVDTDMTGAEAVHVPGTAKSDGLFTVNNTGSDARGYYMDIDPWFSPGSAFGFDRWTPLNGVGPLGFMGFIDGAAEIRVRRNYGTGITVFLFMNAVQAMAPLFGNKADTPFVTDRDCTEWAPALGVLQNPAAMASLRDYVFFGSVALDTMLQEELKLICHCMRIDEDGLIDAVPLPKLTSTVPVPLANRITGADIITPADTYGELPTWEPMRDGRVTTVQYQLEYDALSDSWLDPPAVFMDSLAVSLAKTRGKFVSEIKPYTHASARGLLPAVPGPPQWLRDLAARYLTLFAHDYDVVKICVPFTKFHILCMDVVTLTHGHVPDGTGSRGISARRGVVIERSWPMDPGAAGYGQLTIMLVQNGVSGYTPSAIVTSHTNTSGTTWTLVCNSAVPINQAVSTNGDGLCLEHFQNGDYIRLVEVDAFSPTIVTGVISGTPNLGADSCVVVLDDAWTPGASVWVLEYQEDSATASQEQYAYVADDQLEVLNVGFARMFA